MRDRLLDVLQPVLTEVEQRDARRARAVAAESSTWPPWPERRDPRGEVDVVADVALVGEERRPRVHADPDPDRAGRAPRSVRRPPPALRERSGRRRRRLALGVHLDSVVGSASVADQAPVLGERLCVASAPRSATARRALNVGEEESDGAGWEISSHLGRECRGARATASSQPRAAPRSRKSATASGA